MDMNRQALIERTLGNLAKLPDQKLKEVSDFAEFLLYKLEDQVLLKGISKLAAESKSFDFLNEEEELYSDDDLKEKFK